MGNVDGNAHVGEVEAVRQADESQGDDVVTDQLLEVLAGLFHTQDKDNRLLSPVRGLEEIVELEAGVVRLVGEALVHAVSVEVPDGSAAHGIQTPGSEEGKVQSRVDLLHESSLLTLAEASAAGQRSKNLLHDELAGKGEDNGIEGNKGEVEFALAVLDAAVIVEDIGHLVGEENAIVQGIRLGRVDSIGG